MRECLIYSTLRTFTYFSNQSDIYLKQIFFFSLRKKKCIGQDSSEQQRTYSKYIYGWVIIKLCTYYVHMIRCHCWQCIEGNPYKRHYWLLARALTSLATAATRTRNNPHHQPPCRIIFSEMPWVFGKAKKTMTLRWRHHKHRLALLSSELTLLATS